MSKFNVGDEVKCIDATHSKNRLVKDKIYKVVRLPDPPPTIHGIYIEPLSEIDDYNLWSVDRFVKV